MGDQNAVITSENRLLGGREGGRGFPACKSGLSSPAITTSFDALDDLSERIVSPIAFTLAACCVNQSENYKTNS